MPAGIGHCIFWVAELQPALTSKLQPLHRNPLDFQLSCNIMASQGPKGSSPFGRLCSQILQRRRQRHREDYLASLEACIAFCGLRGSRRTYRRLSMHPSVAIPAEDVRSPPYRRERNFILAFPNRRNSVKPIPALTLLTAQHGDTTASK